MNEQRPGKHQCQPAGNMMHEFGIAEIGVSLPRGQDIEIMERKNIVSLRADNRSPIFEHKLSTEISGDNQQNIPAKTNDNVDRQGFSRGLIQKQSPRHQHDKTPRGDVRHKLVPFDLILRDSSPAGPDFRVDAADERNQQKERPRQRDRLSGLRKRRRSPQQPGGITDQPREQKNQGELDELGMKVGQKLPELHTIIRRAGCWAARSGKTGEAASHTSGQFMD